MKKLILVAALFVFGATVSFGQNEPNAATTEQKVKKPKKSKKVKAHKAHKANKAEEATAYECPMKCEPASAQVGKCGKCGMDLVAMKKKA